MEFEMKILDSRLAEWGIPSYHSSLAAGVDLRACIDSPIEIAPQAPAMMISSGVSILIGRPDIVAIILPRSGLGARQGLILGNSVGVIDPDYQGPWIIPVINRNAADTPPLTIHPGDRIAQALFLPMARPMFRIIDEFSKSTARGSGGFGSTG